MRVKAHYLNQLESKQHLHTHQMRIEAWWLAHRLRRIVNDDIEALVVALYGREPNEKKKCIYEVILVEWLT